jgi:NAD(P)-dependent dehydrogenase (short-subunit alcohol dehydrogenase family)
VPANPSPVVLITGASGGIGRAVALAYAGRGARLVLTGRSGDRLEALARECEERGARASAVTTDITDAAAVRAAVDLAVTRYGGLDVVVHSGAVAAYGRLTRMPDDVWDRAVDISVHGTINVARESLRVFERAGRGSLVVIGSVLGQVTAPEMGAYVTGKWAVHGLVRVLQQEARRTPGVHVGLISPGGIDTSIYADAATYVGHAGSPPPPVLGPDRVARAVLDMVDHRRRHAAVGPLNWVMRLGFTVTPRVYDVLVGPLFRRLALSRRPQEPTPGNAFVPSQDLQR